MIKKIFGREKSSKEEKSSISVIGNPTNVVRIIHVNKNKETGDLEGLPKQWQKLLNHLISEHELSENPDAGLCFFHIVIF